MAGYFAIRQCGYNNWVYCDGDCGVCMGQKIETTDHTEPIRLDYSNGVYIFGKQKPVEDGYGVANADRIAEAVERTRKYLKE